MFYHATSIQRFVPGFFCRKPDLNVFPSTMQGLQQVFHVDSRCYIIYVQGYCHVSPDTNIQIFLSVFHLLSLPCKVRDMFFLPPPYKGSRQNFPVAYGILILYPPTTFVTCFSCHLRTKVYCTTVMSRNALKYIHLPHGSGNVFLLTLYKKIRVIIFPVPNRI